MKTKELIEKLKYVGIDNTDKYIWGNNWNVSKEHQYLKINGFVPKDIALLLAEYIATPIEEREEEKKYRLEMFDNHESKVMLLESYSRQFSMSGLTQWIFTQSEIDNFPPEIKGAIECGFLKKVEVE